VRTKAEAEAVLQSLGLERVAVADVARDGRSRREYTFTLPAGNECTVGTDANPSDEQLDSLAWHLFPLTDAERARARAAMRQPQ
jgi:hypothetical protein